MLTQSFETIEKSFKKSQEVVEIGLKRAARDKRDFVQIFKINTEQV